MTTPGMITLALSKGRIFEETLPLLAAAGIVVTEDPEKSRKLILSTNRPDVRVVLVRATDVPTYVQHGGADIGVAGRDTLIEHSGSHGDNDGLYQPLDLNIAKCRMSVAVRAILTMPLRSSRARASGSPPSTPPLPAITLPAMAFTLTSSSCMARWSWPP